MDSLDRGAGFLDGLVCIRNQIVDKFSRLHKLLQERQSLLLGQLYDIEECYRKRERGAEEIRQLLTTEEQAFRILKDNQHESTLREVIIPLEARVKELCDESERLEKIALDWDSELEMKIQRVGVIELNGRRSVVDHYKSKSRPVRVFGTHKTNSSMPGEFKFPNAIAFDRQSKLIYVCDGGNNRVQVFDNNGRFVFMFCERMITPVGICVFANRVYVTQMLDHSLNVYETNGNFVCSFSNSDNVCLNTPKGVSVSNVTENIYICDCKNGRIVVLNQLLNLVSLIQCNSFPDDIKTADDQIFILTLSNPCILICNYEHQFIRAVISYGPGMQVAESYNIFIDEKCNILITDTSTHCVLVFSTSGDLIARFGGLGDGIGGFVKPRGISMDSDGRIIIASQNPNYSIQLY